MERLNRSGQAAVTDALFMLLIISGLSVMLFSFTASYGNNLSNHVLRQYTVDYATDALKTILYSSTPHHPDQVLEEAEEVDFLLAAVKEEYAEKDPDGDQALSGEIAVTLKKNIERTMFPVADQFDYFFVIVTQENTEYIYMLLYKSEFQCLKKNADGSTTPLPSCEGIIERDLLIVPADPAHNFYLCSNVKTSVLADLIFLAGESSQANAPLLLLKWMGREVKLRTFPAQASLVMWPAALIPQSILDSMECKVLEDN